MHGQRLTTISLEMSIITYFLVIHVFVNLLSQKFKVLAKAI